jgi:hypothetical protein
MSLLGLAAGYLQPLVVLSNRLKQFIEDKSPEM